MDTTGFTSERPSENVTINAATDVVNQIIAAGIDGGKPVALFAEDLVASGDTMVPATSSQNNGAALWVQTGTDLATLGFDPANDQIYCQIWIEALGWYVVAGDVIREMVNNGDSIKLAVT